MLIFYGLCLTVRVSPQVALQEIPEQSHVNYLLEQVIPTRELDRCKRVIVSDKCVIGMAQRFGVLFLLTIDGPNTKLNNSERKRRLRE